MGMKCVITLRIETDHTKAAGVLIRLPKIYNWTEDDHTDLFHKPTVLLCAWSAGGRLRLKFYMACYIDTVTGHSRWLLTLRTCI